MSLPTPVVFPHTDVSLYPGCQHFMQRYFNTAGPCQADIHYFDCRSNLSPIEVRTTTETAVTPEGRSLIVIRG